MRSPPPWLDRRVFPYTSRWIDIEGSVIHYLDEGQGPVLLMLHGNASWSFLYRHLIAVLRRHFRCIALDYPGFGLSSARPGYTFKPDEHSALVENFALALDLRAMRLMVQDWGGPIGLGFAGRRPERVHSLFICNTWAWPAQGTGHVARYSRVAGSALGRFCIMYLNVVQNVMVPAFINHKLSVAERTAYRGPFRTVASRYPMALLAKEILASEPFLAGVENGLDRLRDKPVLLLWGDADTAFGVAELQRFQQIFPDSRTCILPGARHFVQEDAPAEICDAVLKFEKVSE